MFDGYFATSCIVQKLRKITDQQGNLAWKALTEKNKKKIEQYCGMVELKAC